jgi:hypothetical protein
MGQIFNLTMKNQGSEFEKPPAQNLSAAIELHIKEFQEDS